jgi:cytochrome oxidase Cu insertion factor (SCO1/SenC/PrrC family)
MSRNVKTSLIFATLGIAAILLLLLVEWRRVGMEPRQGAETRLSASIGGAFALTDQNGIRRSQADFAGRPLLVYFGFTYCPDVCPTALDIMGGALDALQQRYGAAYQNLQPLFISVDPERDTPPVLRDYLAYFHPRLIGLTGSQADIDAVKSAFKIYAARRRDADDNGNYNVDHSSFFYLMDQQNRYLAHFDHAITPAQLADRLADILAQRR